MAELITIPWSVGEGNIVATIGEGGCTITSSPNVANEPRSQTLTFRTTTGREEEATDTLIVTQNESNLLFLQDSEAYLLVDSNGDYLYTISFYLSDIEGNELADNDGFILYT